MSVHSRKGPPTPPQGKRRCRRSGGAPTPRRERCRQRSSAPAVLFGASESLAPDPSSWDNSCSRVVAIGRSHRSSGQTTQASTGLFQPRNQQCALHWRRITSSLLRLEANRRICRTLRSRTNGAEGTRLAPWLDSERRAEPLIKCPQGKGCRPFGSYRKYDGDRGPSRSFESA